MAPAPVAGRVASAAVDGREVSAAVAGRVACVPADRRAASASVDRRGASAGPASAVNTARYSGSSHSRLCGPHLRTRPPSIQTTWSARAAVDTRWATISLVHARDGVARAAST